VTIEYESTDLPQPAAANESRALDRQVQEILVFQEEQALALAEALNSPSHSEMHHTRVSDPIPTLAPSHLLTLILSRIS
jgi:hypothetical protein